MQEPFYLKDLNTPQELHRISDGVMEWIGRSSECEINVSLGNNFVSRFHAEVFYKFGELKITSRSEKSRTFVGIEGELRKKEVALGETEILYSRNIITLGDITLGDYSYLVLSNSDARSLLEREKGQGILNQ